MPTFSTSSLIYLHTNNEILTISLGILNFLILSLTLGFLIIYTYYTKKIAKETVSSNRIPLLLRVGVLDWNTIQGLVDNPNNNIIGGYFIQFKNYKNVAIDLRGYITINKQKYKLYFGGKDLLMFPKWQSLPENGEILASYNENEGQESNDDNQVCITYKDTEGVSHYTIENKDYDVISKEQPSKFNIFSKKY